MSLALNTREAGYCGGQNVRLKNCACKSWNSSGKPGSSGSSLGRSYIVGSVSLGDKGGSVCGTGYLNGNIGLEKCWLYANSTSLFAPSLQNRITTRSHYSPRSLFPQSRKRLSVLFTTFKILFHSCTYRISSRIWTL